MGVILNRHYPGLICELGDGTLTYPYYPGSLKRSNGYGVNGGNVEAFGAYPVTTPDSIYKLVRGGTAPRLATLLAGPCGCLDGAIVTAGGPPPNPIPGSPFSNDTRASSPYASIYPRWTGETAWDLQTEPATEAFTPQGILSPDVLAYPYPGIGSPARYGVGLDSGVLFNDPSVGGICRFSKYTLWRFFGYVDEVCCWNDGAQIELNLEVWKAPVNATYQAGMAGYQDFTLGTPSYESTITQTVVINNTWSTTTPTQVGTDVYLPQVYGYFTWVNDFYVSSVIAP